MHARAARSSVWAALLAAEASTRAEAAGHEPLVGFAQSILQFLTGTIGPIVVGIGLAVAAFSLIFGSREGLAKAIWAVVGGAMLFGVGSIVSWLTQIAQ